LFEDVKKCVDFTGKTVIVTGGTKGIGEGCARVFMSSGANVVICARDSAVGNRVANEFCGKYGDNKCIYIRCDVSVESDIVHVVDETIRIFGRLDCLVNNAGYHPGYERIDDTSSEMLMDLIQTNLVSIYNFSRHALPYLRKSEGSIINMSSLVGTIGQRLSCRYVLTKGGIIAFTKALAIDEAENHVRVNCISPGCIDTPLGAEFSKLSPDSEREAKLTRTCSLMNRIGNINEVGTVCLFLASEMASFITGVDVVVSGGAELAYGNKQDY
jgi:NAD(P)-dependent dehydrogenase (short-subunit alcohol dehydrogenase family)